MFADKTDIREVVPRSISIPGMRPSTKLLPQLHLKPSEIEGAGGGIFAGEDIGKNRIVTEYGGELISWTTAVHRRQRRKADSHIIGISHGLDALDSRLDDPLEAQMGIAQTFTLNYYTTNHLVGGFINDPYGTGKLANVKYLFHDQGKAYQGPYHQWGGRTSGNIHYSSGRVFLKALRPITSGEELLVDYKTTYHEFHFN
jgi:SET domain-containing protein